MKLFMANQKKVSPIKTKTPKTNAVSNKQIDKARDLNFKQ